MLYYNTGLTQSFAIQNSIEVRISIIAQDIEILVMCSALWWHKVNAAERPIQLSMLKYIFMILIILLYVRRTPSST